MKNKFYLILLFVFICKLSIFSQEYQISGIVTDKKNNEPLPFVNIGIEGVIGTITDYDGNFSITIPQKLKDEKLVVSYVGYETYFLSVSQNLNKNDVKIKLISKDFNIEEVTVVEKSLFPYTILKNVENKISQNYYQSSYNYLISYNSKEYTEKKLFRTRDSEILFYDKLGYKKTSENEIFKNYGYEFLKSEKKFEIYSLIDGYVNFDEILSGDILKFSNNIFDIDFLKDYELELVETVYQNDSVWIISYNCVKPNFLNTGFLNTVFYSGKLTIDKEKYSVLRSDLTVKLSKQSVVGKSFFSNDESNQIKNVEYNYIVEYKDFNGYLFLNSIDFCKTFTSVDDVSKKEINKKIEENLIINDVKINNLEEITQKQYFENL